MLVDMTGGLKPQIHAPERWNPFDDQVAMCRYLILVVLSSLVCSFHPSLCRFVYDSETFTGFWQYGTLQWDEFYQHLRTFVVAPADWTIFQYEPTQEQRGAPCPSGTSIVQEGTYILLSTCE